MDMTSWLNRAVAPIPFAPDRAAVRRELEGHLQDRQETYAAQGLSPFEAQQAATAAMGDPEEIAAELARLHSPWWGYIWVASKWVLLTVFILSLPLLAYDEWSVVKQPIINFFAYIEQGTPSGPKVETGGYTIRLEFLGIKSGTSHSKKPPETYLYLDLHILTRLPGVSPDLRRAVSRVADSTGAVYSCDAQNGPSWTYARFDTEVPWGQKSILLLEEPPEDIQWVDITFGYGEYRRTLRVDVTGEGRWSHD